MDRTKTHKPIANQFVDEQTALSDGLIQSSDYRIVDAERYFKATWGQQLKGGCKKFCVIPNLINKEITLYDNQKRDT